jgi:hypothetical protein
MTQRGLAAGVARWFGREPVLDFVGWDEFARRAGQGPAEVTREHTFRGIAASIARAREVLGYAPRYTSLDALHEALAWLVANGQADVGGQPLRGPQQSGPETPLRQPVPNEPAAQPSDRLAARRSSSAAKVYSVSPPSASWAASTHSA